MTLVELIDALDELRNDGRHGENTTVYVGDGGIDHIVGPVMRVAVDEEGDLVIVTEW